MFPISFIWKHEHNQWTIFFASEACLAHLKLVGNLVNIFHVIELHLIFVLVLE